MDFDGNKYNITNLFIDNTVFRGVGLFGYVDNSNISNVGLIEANITGGSYSIGGLVGYGSYAIINNSFITGNVSRRSNIAGSEIGGLIGQI